MTYFSHEELKLIELSNAGRQFTLSIQPDSSSPVAPAIAYDILAPSYNGSKWSGFWNKNEAPYFDKYVVPVLKSVKSASVLDVGCGTGRYSGRALEYCRDVTGIDISSGMLRVARSSFPRAKFLKKDVRNIGLKRKYTAVIAARALSHVENPGYIISKLSNQVESNGVFFVSDIHPDHSYCHTAFAVGGKKIAISTFKHQPRELFKSSEGFSWVVHSFRRDQLNWNPPIGTFASIDANISNPIFYIAVGTPRIATSSSSFDVSRNSGTSAEE